LSDKDSLILQAGMAEAVSAANPANQCQGIFARRAMGCGIFNPIASYLGNK